MSGCDERASRAGMVGFVKRVLIVAAVGAALFLLWQLRDALLLAFGAVLFAALLRLVAEPLTKWTPLPEGPALLLAGLAVAGVVGLAFWLFGSRIGGQLADVMQRMAGGIGQIETWLGSSGLGRLLLGHAQGAGLSLGGTIGRVLSLGGSLVGWAADLLVVVVAGAYLSARPRLYRTGVVQLFRPRLHREVGITLDDMGGALRLWLLGQFVQMLLIGLISTLAVWLIGLPSPLALGLIAGVLEFVPYAGPVLSAVPAVLVAATIDGHAVLWTVLAYAAIHQTEGHLITPLVQRYVVSIPPALLLLAMAAVGILFGLPGVFLAAPMTVIIFVAVKKLYVRDTLGEPTDVPGES